MNDEHPPSLVRLFLHKGFVHTETSGHVVVASTTEVMEYSRTASKLFPEFVHRRNAHWNKSHVS